MVTGLLLLLLLLMLLAVAEETDVVARPNAVDTLTEPLANELDVVVVVVVILAVLVELV